jgi:rhodanese-related sulfurtransferase
MQRLLEFTQHHPFLFGLLAAIVVGIAVDEALRRARKFREVSPAQGVLLLNKGAAALDLRSSAEFSAGHIINARNLPLPELDARIGELDKLKEQPLLLYCKSGDGSQTAATRLGKLGFQQLHVLKGGLGAWQQEQFPLERR